MRKLLTALLMGIASFCMAQLTTLPSGGNKKATVGERVGITDISIRYSRPGVKGREGKIWGGLVYTGYADLGFGNTRQAPWRAGANENTVISFSNDVMVESAALPAGTYGLFMAYDPGETTVIFSKNSDSWGSYYYDPKEDALRVKVKPQPLNETNEWLKYEFTDQTDSSATIRLSWEKLSIPFRITTNLTNHQLASFRKELRSEKGFFWLPWNQAAQWCAERKVNLDQALQWADSATSPNFGGSQQFPAHATRAQILTLLGRDEEAGRVMKNAMNFASMQEVHQYGRQLLAAKKTKEAMEVFTSNAAKYPKQFTTLMGMARGYSAMGDYKSALKLARQAQPLAPDPLNKANMETVINLLKEGKDIN